MTTHYLVLDLDFEYDGSGDSDDKFDLFSDRVMDALCELEEVDSGIVDPDIAASLAKRKINFYMGVKADSTRDAERLFLANVRTALHAAGCSTPDWPTLRNPYDLPTPTKRELASAS
ncbi:MAG TPA: hypothetical protein VIP77_22040 [Jiangellaceae bacterium]